VRRSIAITTVILLMAIAPAASAKPVTGPPSDAAGETIDLAAGEACEFATNLTVTKGKFGGVFFDDSAILTSPGLAVEITNTATGASVELNIPGVFHETYLPDGTSFIVGTGKNLLFGLFDGEPAMMAIDGHFEATIDPGLVSFIGLTVNGNATDVCALLD